MDEFLEAMVGASDLDDLLRPVMELAIADAPAQGCTIHWGWSDEQGFAHHTGLGVHPALRRSQGITTDELPWCGAARRSETVVLPVLGDGDAFASEASCRGFGAVWSFPIPGDLDDRIVLSVWRGREGAPSSSNRLSVNRVLHMAALAFQRHRTEEQLRHAALHDPLTGAPNRTVLDTHLESVLAEPDGTDALFVLDLDGFKQINDEHGHPTGDLVLRAVVDRIDHALRPGDLLARLGGDEFAVVCQAISDADEAAAIAQRLLAAISEPLAVDGRNVQVGASVGISLTGPDQTPNQLLRSADQALIAAKRQGKGTLVFASTT
jgi:diguanylate cyclase (GGDEF)-like protein